MKVSNFEEFPYGFFVSIIADFDLTRS